jgi:hypothetical protein
MKEWEEMILQMEKNQEERSALFSPGQ